MLTKLGSEQRRFSRVPFKKVVRFKPKDFPLFASNTAQDLSQGGIRLGSSSFIPLGTMVTLQIKLADEGPVVDMQGKVVWVKYLAHTDNYQIGLEFGGDAAYGRLKIAQYVSKAQ